MGVPPPPHMVGGGVVPPPPLPPHLLMGIIGGNVAPPLPPPPPGMLNALRLSSGLLFSQPTAVAPVPAVAPIPSASAADSSHAHDQIGGSSEVYTSAVAEQLIREADEIVRGMQEVEGAGAAAENLGQKRSRSNDGGVGEQFEGEPQVSLLRTE